MLIKCLRQITSQDFKAIIIIQRDHRTFTTQDLQEQKSHILAIKTENLEINLLIKFMFR